MSRQPMLDVVVVGAGVVGAATALAFARDGLRVALVESREPARWQASAPDLRVYAFAPDNAALLDDLGVWDSIRAARLQPYRAMRIWDAAGGGKLVFDADRLGQAQLGWIVENGLLVDRLWAALPGAGVELHCPDAATALEQDDDGAVLALESGRRLRARLVVAADGADSPVRAMAGIEAPRHDYGQRGLVAYIDHEQPHQATCWQRFLPGGPLAFLPCTHDAGRPRSSIVWSLPESEATRLLAVDEPALLAELAHAFDGPLGGLVATSSRAAFPLRRQLARSQVAGRVVLVGDAAHAVHPLAGQGVNLGLRDVAALRSALAEPISRGGDVGRPARLQRWARARRSDNALSAYAFEGINRLFSNDALAPTLLRGRLLGAAGKVGPLTRALWRHAAGI